MKAYERFLGYSYEGFLIFLGLILIAMFQNRPPALPAFLAIFILVFGVLYIFYRLWHSISYVVVFFLMIGFSLAAWMLGFSPVIAVLLSAACCWRATVYLFAYTRWEDAVNGIRLLMVSIFFAMFLTVCVPLYHYHGIIFVVIVLQLVYLLGMKLLQRAVSFVPSERSVRPAFLRNAATGIAGILFLSLLASIIYTAVKNIFFTGFGFLFKTVFSVLAYPMFLLFRMLHLRMGTLNNKHKAAAQNGNHRKPNLSDTHQISHFPHWIIYGFLIALGIAVLLYLARKTKLARVPDKGENENEMGADFTSEAVARKRLTRVKPPSDEVRRLFFRLQGVLGSCGLGRLPNEPVRDWFQRIQLDPRSKAEAETGYRKVRYGEEKLSVSEKKNYEAAIEHLIREAKEIRNKKD